MSAIANKQNDYICFEITNQQFFSQPSAKPSELKGFKSWVKQTSLLTTPKTTL